MNLTDQIVEKHGLKLEEYENIKKLLKRIPNLLELGIFSAMWNEHCSYKSSRLHLKKLPTKGENVIQGPGENAGVIDIGDNDAIVFKISFFLYLLENFVSLLVTLTRTSLLINFNFLFLNKVPFNKPVSVRI